MEDSGYCGRRMLYLRALAVILVLAREFLAFELVEDFSYSLCGFRQHMLERNARSQLALGLQSVDAGVQKRRDNQVIVGQFTRKSD